MNLQITTEAPAVARRRASCRARQPAGIGRARGSAGWVPGYDPHRWIARLKAWDPQNGFAYLLEADANVHWWEAPWTKYDATPGGLGQALAAEPRWRIPMEKAFAARRLDFYHAEQFALDRQVLLEQGFDRPDMLLAAGWAQPLPDLATINFYEGVEFHDAGEAEKAGRTDDALAVYWSVVHFANRLEATPLDLAHVCATKLHRDAYHRLLPLFESTGRTAEAAASSVQASASRSARLILISAVFAAVFGFATALWLASVIALRWKPSADTLSRLLNRLASRLFFAPPALLFASVAVFLGYYPYARSLAEIHSYQELE